MPRFVGGFGSVTIWAFAAIASAQQSTLRKDSVKADSAIPGQQIRLYLSPIRVDSAYRLTPNGYSGATHVQQNVDFTDRRDSARVAPVIGVPTRVIDTWNGVQFVSPQLATFELNGQFSGQLDLITNTPDFDFQISLYELTASGDYIPLSTYSTQDTALHKSQHALLQTGVRQHVDYESSRHPRRVIHNGSRLVLLITILRQPNVAIDDSTDPLRISWYGESYIELAIKGLLRAGLEMRTPRIVRVVSERMNCTSPGSYG